jgi:hypothetical protein
MVSSTISLSETTQLMQVQVNFIGKSEAQLHRCSQVSGQETGKNTGSNSLRCKEPV